MESEIARKLLELSISGRFDAKRFGYLKRFDWSYLLSERLGLEV
jgi:hypothetical protein